MAQQNIINFQNYCRTCGNSTDELISIFDDEGLGYELNIKISTYLHLQVEKSDTLPLNVCIECTTTLLSFHNLYRCCLKAKEHYESIEFTPDSTKLREVERNDSVVPETLSNKENKTYDRSNDLSKDIDEHANNKGENTHALEVSSSCQYCAENVQNKASKSEMIFQNKAELVDHLKDVHTDLIFLCEVCKDYLPRSNLLEHMTSHAISLELLNRQNEEIKCDKCTKVFTTSNKLQRHKKVAHQKPQKSFQCLDCDKIFNTGRVLRNHINHKHSDNRKYKCDLCQKTFKTDSGLYAHRKTHTDSYDYSCPICLKKFKFKVHLSRHMTMHSQEKNYFCRFCTKSFGVKDNLQKHLKTHYKLFEFKCHICEFLTSQQRYLAMHMKTSHLVKKM